MFTDRLLWTAIQRSTLPDSSWLPLESVHKLCLPARIIFISKTRRKCIKGGSPCLKSSLEHIPRRSSSKHKHVLQALCCCHLGAHYPCCRHSQPDSPCYSPDLRSVLRQRGLFEQHRCLGRRRPPRPRLDRSRCSRRTQLLPHHCDWEQLRRH